MKEKVICLWSGGKDSCFACYQAMQQGYQVSYLLNFISQERGRSLSHGLDAELIALQAKATGISFIQKRTSRSNYEGVFKQTIDGLKDEGIESVVFGDIYLQEHKDWIDKVCKELKVKPIFPLWKLRTQDIVEDFIEKGFEAIVVSAKQEIFTDEWLGRKIDRNFIEDVRRLEKDIDLCGESGEFHSFVVNGPIFKKRIKILEADKISRDGYHNLDIKKYRLEDKSES